MERAKAFYRALGLQVVEEIPGVRVEMRWGTFTLMLMTFLDENLIQLRGGDVCALYDHLRAQGVEVPGQPERYPHGSAPGDSEGTCWTVRDPDGNALFFDTPRGSEGQDLERRRLSERLRAMEQELVLLGASEDCLRAFRGQVLERFSR